MAQSETINILCATDDNYAPYCGIMLTSLFESNNDCRFQVFVFLDGSLSEENERRYNSLGLKYGNEIVLMRVDEEKVKGFPLKKDTYVTLATYYRLMVAEWLPKEVRKVVYLDGDMVVVGDVRSLWDLNLDGVAVAGVRGPRSSYEDVCKYLGYSGSLGYFNAGVLVLNLDYWRTHGITEKVIKFVKDHCGQLPMMDQDVLNGALYNEKMILPDRYNYMTMCFLRKNWENYAEERRQVCVEEGDKRVVVHYLGRVKPWDYRHYGGPFYSEWEKYRRKSLWRDCRNKNTFIGYAKHLAKRYVFPNLLKKQHPEWAVTHETKRFYS